MATKKRDYRAEYARRIARGKELGYSRRVARGHPGKRELGIRAAAFVGEKPGFNIDAVVRADALRVFGGKVPKRGRYHPDTGEVTQRRKGESLSHYKERTQGWEGESVDEYQMRLAKLRSGPGNFNWTKEELFIAQMKAIGLNERDAYTHWFSP